jgi:hypothetical protein
MSIQPRDIFQRANPFLHLVLVCASICCWQRCDAGLTAGGLAEVVLVDLNGQSGQPNQGDNAAVPPSASASESGSTAPALTPTGSGSGPVASGGFGAVPAAPRKRSRQNSGNFGPGNGGGAGGGGAGGGSGGGSSSGGTGGPNGLGGGASPFSPGGSGGLSGTGASSSGLGGSVSLSETSVPGSSAANPLLPSSINGDAYGFNYTVTPGGLGSTASPLYVDPPLATGYLVTVDSGPNILTVTDTTNPSLLLNTTLLTVNFDGHTGTFAPGGTFDFGAVEPGGVNQFTITGISPADVAANPLGEFVTSFTFAPSNGTQAGQITETALHGPEPASLTLWTAGALSLLGWRQLRGKKRATS